MSSTTKQSNFQLIQGLASGYVFMLLLMAFLTIAALFGMDRIQSQLKYIADKQVTLKMELAMQMLFSARERTFLLQQMLLTEDPFEQDEQHMEFNALAGEFIKARLQILDMPLSPEEKSLLQEQSKVTGVAVPLQKQIIDFIQQDRREEAYTVLIKESVPTQNKVLQILSQFYQLQQSAGKQSIDNALNMYHRGRYSMIVLSIGLVFLGAILAFFIVRKFSIMTKQREIYLKEIEDAKDSAQQASKAKSRFLANMSHELRTPLNAIIGYSELVLDESNISGNQELKHDLKKIHQSGQHLLRLISDVLDVSKIESGQVDLKIQEGNLKDLLESVLIKVYPMIETNNNKLTLHYSPEEKNLYTDLGKIHQILLNLFSNAAKFTENGTITFESQCFDNDAQHWIKFTIRDTGIGIKEEQIGLLFNSFTRADTSSTSRYGGTGLGLTLCRHYCNLLGGTIDISSKFGEGTTIVVALPARIHCPLSDQKTTNDDSKLVVRPANKVSFSHNTSVLEPGTRAQDGWRPRATTESKRV